MRVDDSPIGHGDFPIMDVRRCCIHIVMFVALQFPMFFHTPKPDMVVKYVNINYEKVSNNISPHVIESWMMDL